MPLMTVDDVLAEMAILPKPLKPFADQENIPRTTVEEVLTKMAELPKPSKPFAHGGFGDGRAGHE